jgi:hypothetical protein
MRPWKALVYRLVGARRYIACAIASPSPHAAARYAECRACPHATAGRVGVWPLRWLIVTCGPAFTESENTCGCVVSVVPFTIGNRIMKSGSDLARLAINAGRPAGKAACASEACPQGRWDNDTTDKPTRHTQS